MFLSQIIASNPKFLQLSNTKDVRSLVDIRVKIMQAAKFVVSTDQLMMNVSTMNESSDIFLMMTNRDKIMSRLGIYKKFARLPFKTLFIENNYGGVLVETTQNKTYMVTVLNVPVMITAQGKQNVELSTLKHLEISKIGFELIDVDGCFSPIIKDSMMAVHNYDEKYLAAMNDPVIFRDTKGWAISVAMQIAEILLFLNVNNKRIHTYKLNKTEGRKIPPTILPKYEYRVLDIYRDHPVYIDQTTISDQLFCNNEEASKRRMHFVRGHFKQKKNGLFWWNAFVRNARNRDTVGVVDKTYRLKDNES